MGSIVVQSLGKAYKQYPNRWSRLLEWLSPRKKIYHNLKWVMQDVSFIIRPGEAVGIIGINGAGKSTLLKMITGTTRPTTGSVSMSGRVAALLELGMGFHADFTGRQNVFMAGQLLGYSVEEITRLMPEIEAFAEIGDYIDQSVRVYSSGMQVRLAFSVATAIRPDILIVDEALSVGDAYFQHKSFDRIREFRKQGTTLLFVSHDKGAIQTLCDRAILLSAGHLAMEGKPEAVMDYYNAMLADRNKHSIHAVSSKSGKVQIISGTGKATVTELTLLDLNGCPVSLIEVGQDITLRVMVKTNELLKRLIFGYGIKDRYGQLIYGTNTDIKEVVFENIKKGAEIQFDFRFNMDLGQGSYSIQTALTDDGYNLSERYEWRELGLLFEVINTTKPIFAGMLWLNSKADGKLLNNN